MIDSSQSTSTRPYLLRALYEWCADNGFTPYIAAYVDDSVKVPREYVKNNEIVLNVSMDATSHLKLGNEYVEFKARFGGVAREIVVPMSHVIAIYARENGQGMAFPAPQLAAARADAQPAPAAPKAKQGLHSVVTEGDSTSPMPASAADAEPNKVVSLKTPSKGNGAAAEGPDEPPTPNSPKPSRPALTRIK